MSRSLEGPQLETVDDAMPRDIAHFGRVMRLAGC